MVNVFIQLGFTVYQWGTKYCFSLWRYSAKWEQHDPWTQGASRQGSGKQSQQDYVRLRVDLTGWCWKGGLERIATMVGWGGWDMSVEPKRLRTSQQVNEGMRNSIPSRGNRKGKCLERTRWDCRTQRKQVTLIQKEWQLAQEWVVPDKGVGGQSREPPGSGWGGLDCTASAGGQPWRVLNTSVTQPRLFKALFDYLWIRRHKTVSVRLGSYRRHSGRQHRQETQVCFSSLEGPTTLMPGEKQGCGI